MELAHFSAHILVKPPGRPPYGPDRAAGTGTLQDAVCITGDAERERRQCSARPGGGRRVMRLPGRGGRRQSAAALRRHATKWPSMPRETETARLCVDGDTAVGPGGRGGVRGKSSTDAHRSPTVNKWPGR